MIRQGEMPRHGLRLLLALVAGLLMQATAQAQEFFNLTASEVRIDSMLPVFTYQRELGSHYADSVYEVSIEYPEFIDMTKTDIARLQAITTREWPEMPKVEQHLSVARKEGYLDVSFVPIVMRDGKLQKLVSFQLAIRAAAPAAARSRVARAVSADKRYAAHSVLASGKWAKISVPETGVYEITTELIRQAGFTDLSRVKVYGYGGALQPEALTGEYLQETDDLKEVATCMVGGKRLMYAVGPVNWNSVSAVRRVRNNYSTVGCYFITESDDEPQTISEADFVKSFYPGYNDYHSLYEPEEFAWFHGGRNLFGRTDMGQTAVTCLLESTATQGTLSVNVSYDGNAEIAVEVNGEQVGTINCTKSSIPDNSTATEKENRFQLTNLLVGQNTIKLYQKSGTGVSRLDYAMLTFGTPKAQPDFTAQLPVPQYMYNITNQDLHADAPIDMLIVIPMTQQLLSQAERLKELHETRDSMRVRILPADELYNEFSSGTPDANAYRRYLKMHYDRAEKAADQPSYLLLLGDCAWDNRMLCNDWNGTSPDDFLLCYESENSFSETSCFISDDYFCLLDDKEEIETSGAYLGKPDVAAGRLSARTSEEARIMVDKTIDYHNNVHAGPWQNTICFMGDDGNKNIHMYQADSISATIDRLYPGYNIKKVYWDAYNRQTTSTGNGFPDVTRILKQQMRDGALVMNYTGHGAPYCVSHEKVLWRSDFAEATSMRLPLWVTASCDIMPFDGQEENIGETAMLNPKGGAIAFFGTTRTVFVTQNVKLNMAFMKHLLSTRKGKRISIGEAARLTKVEMVSSNSDRSANKLQYSLLGDPALVLAAPTLTAQIDTINGQPVSNGTLKLAAGEKVTVKGYIQGNDTFNGRVTATVRDVEEFVVCKINNINDGGDKEVPDTAFTFRDRPSTIYVGSDSVRNGRFSFTFAVPKDISYSDDQGLMLLYAINADHSLEAHGRQEGISLGDSDESTADGVGPNIYCYLNSPSFTNGGTVNATPYFYAELNDKDGINAAGNGIGHDLELIIDGEMNRTYNLNSSFQYNFGDYQSGTVGYSIPELEAGPHTLLFRAWDIFNNSSISTLSFVVDPNLQPGIAVDCTQNPASTATTFIISHDREGSMLDVTLEVFDTSGRKLWEKRESGLSTGQTYTLDWDLTVGSGSRLHAGVYLYRILVGAAGGEKASKAKKLIIVGNK